MIMIYVILVAQTGSFLVPLVVMLAIPLTALGVMRDLDAESNLGSIDRDASPMRLLYRHGHDWHDRSLGNRHSRLDHPRRLHQPNCGQGPTRYRCNSRKPSCPIETDSLTAGAAMLSSLPITLDPSFRDSDGR